MFHHLLKSNAIWQIPDWIKYYQKSNLSSDIIAGLIVGILVIPQSLGYAILAGLPPVYGLYASIVPVMVYAWIGSSSVNAVGAVSVSAVMTSQALVGFHHLPLLQYIMLATTLAFLVGIILTLASILRLGWVTQFISRGVTSGFISGTAILIFISQLKHLTGIPIVGKSILDYAQSFVLNLSSFHLPTLIVGVMVFISLEINRLALPKWLGMLSLPKSKITAICRIFPLILVAVVILASIQFHFSQFGIRLSGSIPSGLPQFTTPIMTPSILAQLLPSALLIALISFISSHAVASSLARERNEHFNANQELMGLGLANLVGSFFQSFAITGGISRTAINISAGAKTPLASLITVAIMIASLLVLNDVIAPLPYAVLGAIIMSGIIKMVDIDTLKYALKFDQLEAVTFMVTFIMVLTFGLNIGLVSGILFSFGGLIWNTSRPHIAIVGQVGCTEHFRNICRHHVIERSDILIIRIDESLFYGNAISVRTFIDQALKRQDYQHLILMLSAVNHIDLTAQEMLINLNCELGKHDKSLHLSDVKGPVMDIISQTPVIKELTGKVFLSTADAIKHLHAYDDFCI
ncbi:sulfate permease [Moraxella nasovis]|uniref:SulP family inorganic anion transporter n=1 Tax=Moraxella nasovis TaxID=2904121 RepID=UPI001F620512|nr:sulfate permease [Moraxella nasovis]UNU72875.1 sulfate permease [Moraxella nasovis]